VDLSDPSGVVLKPVADEIDTHGPDDALGLYLRQMGAKPYPSLLDPGPGQVGWCS
jgi:hypothetical protein